ncbi:MAG: hypothetical protein IBV52_05250 [Candidatus Bathyarchaeota archaeon]
MMIRKNLFAWGIVLFVLLILLSIIFVGASSSAMWNQTYGGTAADVASSVVETSDGGYAMAGYTQSFGAIEYDFLLVKTDWAGNIEWNQTYGGAELDFGLSVVETSDGGYAIAGSTSSFGAGGYDFWLLKSDENGIIPEYPSWILPSLLLVATLVIVINKKRLFHPRS